MTFCNAGCRPNSLSKLRRHYEHIPIGLPHDVVFAEVALAGCGNCPRKKHKREEIVAKLRQVDIALSHSLLVGKQFARLE
jgi:hypothetical protein